MFENLRGDAAVAGHGIYKHTVKRSLQWSRETVTSIPSRVMNVCRAMRHVLKAYGYCNWLTNFQYGAIG